VQPPAEPSAPPPVPEGETRPTKPKVRERIADARRRADDLAKRAAERAEVERGRRASVRRVFEMYERDKRFAGGLLAGGLAFRLFLWLLPFALVVVSALGLFVDATDRTVEDVAKQGGLSRALAATVARAVDASGHGRIGLLVLGLVLLVVAGRSAVRALNVVQSLAWQIDVRSAKPTVVASIAFSGIVFAAMSLQLVFRPLWSGGLISDLAAALVSVIAAVAVCVFALRVLPHPPDVPATALLPGAAAFAIGIEIVRIVAAVYLAPKLARTEDLYGALGLSAVFLFWLYLIARLFVVGSVLNATLWRARGQTEAEGTP
jgi:uncharacterized BrkB/YihY/UPF0761 family membrane protein